MAQTPGSITVTVRPDATGEDLVNAIRASGELAVALDVALEAILAGDRNPVVIPRQVLAPVQAALDDFRVAAASFFEEHEGDAADTVTDEAGAPEPIATAAEPRPAAPGPELPPAAESPTDKRRRELRA